MEKIHLSRRPGPGFTYTDHQNTPWIRLDYRWLTCDLCRQQVEVGYTDMLTYSRFICQHHVILTKGE